MSDHDDTYDDDGYDDDAEDFNQKDPNLIEGATAATVLEYITKAVVDEPDQVEVETSEGRRGTVSLEVHVADDDMGRVIGKRGRVANSIRTVVRAAAAVTGSRSTSSSSSSPVPDPVTLLEVGRVAKAHGLRGEVVVALSTNRPDRVAKGSVLHTDRGPLTVVASRPHQKRHIVRFAGVDTREGAEALHGLVLSAEPLDDPGALWVHELIGGVVVDQHGTEHGRVAAVEVNPASDLLVLDDGRLVPLTFVVGQDEGRILVDVPDGLL